MAGLRQACDRCHGMKLRCPKPFGSLSCTRCSKANTPCIFSPPTRPLRSGPPTHAEPPAAHAHAHDAAANGAAAFDWASFLALDSVDTPAAFLTASIPSSPPQTLPTAGDANGGASPSVTVQLAEMLLALDGILSSFPNDTVHHVPRGMLKHYADTVGDKFELHTTLEQLLRHTQHLAAVYPEALRRATIKVTDPQADTCTVPDCIHLDRTDLRTRALPKVDYALLNLLLACHQRLLDILDTLVEHGRVCAYMTSRLPEGYDPKFDIPEIRIGSFVAPQESAAFMLVSMLFELQTVLIKKSQDFGDAASAVSADSPRQAKVIGLQCEVLTERAEGALEELKRLKEGLVNIGLIK